MSALGEERGTRARLPSAPHFGGCSLQEARSACPRVALARPGRRVAPPERSRSRRLMRGSWDPRARLRPRTWGPC